MGAAQILERLGDGGILRASELAARKAPARPPLATGAPDIDRLLSGGLPRGALVELAGHRSCGRFAAVLAALASATGGGECAALVDLAGALDPRGAEEAGVELARLLWVRPADLKQAVRCAEVALSAGFALVALDLGIRLHGPRVRESAWIRLARSAQAQGSCLLLSTPWPLRTTAAAAVVSLAPGRPVWRRARPRSPALLSGIRCRATLERSRQAAVPPRRTTELLWMSA